MGNKTDRRPISALSATALVIGNMLGVGLFTTTGFLAGEIADPSTILALWAVGGILALCGADVYAELGAMMPRVGGEYIYLSRTFSPIFGFLSGWVSLLVGFSAPIALTAHAFGLYLNAAFPSLPTYGSATGLIAVLAIIHMRNVRWSGIFHTISTLYKVILVIGFVGAALLVGKGDWSNFSSTVQTPPIDQLALGLVFVAFSYSGWNVAAYVAGEMRQPERNLPRALLTGTCIVLILFLLLNTVFFYAVPQNELAASPAQAGHIASNALFGGSTADVTSLLIAIALISSASAMIMAGPRVYAAMSEDGLFFSIFARRNKGGAPWVSVLFQCGIAVLMLFTYTFLELLTYIGVILSAFAGLTIIAAFVLRYRFPNAKRPYRAHAWPLSPVLYLTLVSSMTIVALLERPAVLLAASGTLILGIILYYIWTKRFAVLQQTFGQQDNSHHPGE